MVLGIFLHTSDGQEAVSTTDSANIFTIELGLFNCSSCGDAGAIVGGWDECTVAGLTTLDSSLPNVDPDAVVTRLVLNLDTDKGLLNPVSEDF